MPYLFMRTLYSLVRDLLKRHFFAIELVARKINCRRKFKMQIENAYNVATGTADAGAIRAILVGRL